MSKMVETRSTCSIRSQRVAHKLVSSFSCLLVGEVQELLRAKNISLPEGASPLEGLRALHAHYGTRPTRGEEVLWLSDPVARRLIQGVFLPERPKSWELHPRTWLTDEDIEFVLTQYEQHIGDDVGFRYIGCHPSDFNVTADASSDPGMCVSPALCGLRVADMVRGGIHSVGVTFNTDVSTGPGQHWTACFVGIDPTNPERYGCFYYDSVGRKPFHSALEFMTRMRDEMVAEKLPAPAMRFNPVRKQFLNTECGMYSIAFIVVMLTTDLPFQDVCTEVMSTDDAMHRLRKVFFRQRQDQDHGRLRGAGAQRGGRVKSSTDASKQATAATRLK